ncbi:MAG: nuclear transport factor 2 family protein [Balneolaceae bacterium]|nr:nuclear transport factor 2 family protein [Balneolaceae bacterium]
MAMWILPVLNGCQPQDPEGPGRTEAIDTVAIQSEIDNLRSTYQQAVADGDYEKLSTLVTADARMVQPGSADWDAMREGLQAPFPPGATIDIRPIEINVMSNSWVYEMGRSTITYTPEGADEPVTLRDTYLVILKRTADGWKVHREVASSYLPEQGE